MQKGDLPGEVFDCLTGAPNGLTKYQMAQQLGAPVERIQKAIRQARMILAHDDTLFILCEPQGAREPWLYRLVDGSVIVDAEETAWTANRVGDAESRLRLLEAAMEVATHATGSRTPLGRKARVLEKGFRRLVEDIDELNEIT